MSDGSRTIRESKFRAGWRFRAGVVLAGLGVVAAGLLTHYTGVGATADFLADALYAVLIYLLVILVVPRTRPITTGGIAYGICVLVELAQLTDGPAAVAAVFPPAVLVLGNTFALVDLIAYAVGIAAALTCVALLRTLRLFRPREDDARNH